jgi:Homing endonuclease associated repeat
MKKTIFRNGIRHPLTTHRKAAQLRQEGKTHREIAKELSISLGSADLWTRGIVLSLEQKLAIEKRRHRHILTTEEKKRLQKKLKLFHSLHRRSDEELIGKIQGFHSENGRIPLKREFNAWRVFRDRFGTWNNAIKIAGFKTNPVLFAHKFTAIDGHRCDSFTEKIIDDWLSEHHIVHERSFRYGETKMTADFFIQPNIIVEFFGLAGVQKHYDEIIERKRAFCKGAGLRLLEIYPEDIFPNNNLSALFTMAHIVKI